MNTDKQHDTKIEVSDLNKSVLIYPGLKKGREVELEIIKNDIMPVKAEETVFFSPDFRFCNAVIDAVALKYNVGEDTLLNIDEETEHFLIGSSACRNVRDNQENVYLRNAVQSFKSPSEDIIGIYLLGLDKSDSVNRQYFIILTKKHMHLRFGEAGIREYDYNDIYFTEDGIANKNCLNNTLLEYPLDSRFVEFANEFLLLKTAKLSDIGARHPASDISDPEHRRKYLSFLVDVCIAGGGLTAMQLLKLEYLARGFRVSASSLESLIFDALKDKISDNKLKTRFYETVKIVSSEGRQYVFYNDILEMAVGDNGEKRCAHAVSFLQKTNYAGEDFVSSYLQFIASRRKSQNLLLKSALSIKDRDINVNDFYEYQSYCNEFVLQTLEMEVNINVER